MADEDGREMKRLKSERNGEVKKGTRTGNDNMQEIHRRERVGARGKTHIQRHTKEKQCKQLHITSALLLSSQSKRTDILPA